MSGMFSFTFKIHSNNILPWSHTKKVKINEIQSKYQKKEKKKKPKKYGSPQDSNLGVVALEAECLSIGVARGVHLC
jgi:hypothetical protein